MNTTIKDPAHPDPQAFRIEQNDTASVLRAGDTSIFGELDNWLGWPTVRKLSKLTVVAVGKRLEADTKQLIDTPDRVVCAQQAIYTDDFSIPSSEIDFTGDNMHLVTYSIGELATRRAEFRRQPQLDGLISLSLSVTLSP